MKMRTNGVPLLDNALKWDYGQITVFLTVLGVSLLYVWATQERKGRLRRPPPGPWGVPVLGILPFLGDAAYLTFTRMSEQYGSVFQVYMGSRRTVVVNGVKAARQVLVVQSDDFAGRPDFETFKHISGGNSITFNTYSPRLKLHKKIAISALRQFTQNPAVPIEEALHYEANLLIEDLLKDKDKPINFCVRVATASVVYGLCYGATKTLRQDTEFKEFLRNQVFEQTVGLGGNPVDMFPWLRVFLQSKIKGFIERNQEFVNFNSKIIEEHHKSYNPNKLRDVVDVLKKIADEHPEDVMQAAGLNKQYLFSITMDLIGAGQATVTTTLCWLVLYMVTFPDVQARVQNEIDEVLKGKLPQPDDRKKMPYTEAVILETWRFSVQTPFLIPHASMKDTTLFDYDVPKDTLVFINMWSVNRDPDVWHDPDTFDPTRFLDEDGFVDKCKAEDVFAFGGGKRRCLGEFLARQECFIFFTMLLQRLNFEKAGESYDLKGKFGLSLEPQDYKYIIKERHPKAFVE